MEELTTETGVQKEDAGAGPHTSPSLPPHDPCCVGSRWRRDDQPEEKTQERKQPGKNLKGWLRVVVQIQATELG